MTVINLTHSWKETLLIYVVNLKKGIKVITTDNNFIKFLHLQCDIDVY